MKKEKKYYAIGKDYIEVCGIKLRGKIKRVKMGDHYTTVLEPLEKISYHEGMKRIKKLMGRLGK